MQGNHEGIKRLRRLEAQTKKHPKEKRKPWQGIRSQDPQQPSRGADSFRHKDKGRRGQLEKKRQKKKIRNKSKRTQAPVEPSDLSWYKQKKTSGNQNREAQKKKE